MKRKNKLKLTNSIYHINEKDNNCVEVRLKNPLNENPLDGSEQILYINKAYLPSLTSTLSNFIRMKNIK